MDINYKDIAEVKTEIAIIKERQKVIEERLGELLDSNKSMADELKAYREDAINPRRETVTIVIRSAAMVIASLFAALMAIIFMG